MPAARGVKRAASKASASASDAPKIKKKHGITLDVPSAKRQRGRLYACGQGDVGQLGLGEDVVETPRFVFVSALGEKIVDACAGGMHTVALDSDGKVWTFGCNDEGALGRTGDEQAVGRVELPRKAVAISAGDSHTAALLDNGHVYLWGSFRDSHGSMGLVCHGREGKSCSSPVRLDLPEDIVEIASGGDHLVLLTTTGAVYTMGCGEQGQLGRLSQRSASRHARAGLSALLQPAQVTLKAPMRRVWAGSHGSLALPANAAKLPAWGLNNYNQLGITGAKKKIAVYTPLEADAFSAVDDVESWTHISCGQHHSLALDSNGKCYAVGRHDYGRLGLGEGSGDSESLAAIPKLGEKKCVSVSASTSSSFAVTDSGEVYAWGMGSEGQLGTGKEDDHPEPCLVSVGLSAPHKAIKISAGGQHTVLLAVNLDDPVEEPEPEPPAAEEPAKADVKEVKEAKEPKPAGRRGRAARRDEEPTTSAEVMEVDEKGPEKKLNGDEESAPMETDETDKPQESADIKDTETDMEVAQPEKSKDEPKPEESKPKETREEEHTTQVKEDIAEDKKEVKPAEVTPTETEVKQAVVEADSKVEETVAKVAETEAKSVETETKVADSPVPPVENIPETESKPAEVERPTDIDSKPTEIESKPTDIESKLTDIESKPTEIQSNVAELENKTTEAEIKQSEPESKIVEPAPKDVEMSAVNGEEQRSEIVEKKITNAEAVVSEAL